MLTVGLIGLGEAGASIGAGLREEGGVSVVGYDVRHESEELRDRAEAADITMAADLSGAVRDCDVVLCLTSAKVAEDVALEIAPLLVAGQVYSDWNSASPDLMRRLDEIVRATGAHFADGAVMGAVPPLRHRVPVLVSGAGAWALLEAMQGTGMALEVVGDRPGQASAVKMLRSLLIKGLEALLLECTLGAHRYGVTERVLESMDETLSASDWRALAAYLLDRTVQHGERRAEELRQVSRTLSAVGVAPVMADAGAARLQWLVDLGVGRGTVPRGTALHDLLVTIEEAEG